MTENLLPLLFFVFAGLFSPGPNVVMLTASGARFGFRATLPHLFGVVLGVGIIGAVSGLGMGGLLQAFPRLALVLKLCAAGWILWMAWQLFHASRAGRSTTKGRPMRFHEAVLFQWINAKVWAVAVAAGAGFPADAGIIGEAIRLAGAFSGINLIVCLFWTSTGSLLGRLLGSELMWRRLMSVMAALMAGSCLLLFV